MVVYSNGPVLEAVATRRVRERRDVCYIVGCRVDYPGIWQISCKTHHLGTVALSQNEKRRAARKGVEDAVGHNVHERSNWESQAA